MAAATTIPITLVPKFPLGQTVATPGALDALIAAKVNAGSFLARHAAGDWGEIGAEDRGINEAAVRDGDRLLSAYTLPTGTKLWIITEADRSVTTVLLPEEY